MRYISERFRLARGFVDAGSAPAILPRDGLFPPLGDDVIIVDGVVLSTQERHHAPRLEPRLADDAMRPSRRAPNVSFLQQ